MTLSIVLYKACELPDNVEPDTVVLLSEQALLTRS